MVVSVSRFLLLLYFLHMVQLFLEERRSALGTGTAFVKALRYQTEVRRITLSLVAGYLFQYNIYLLTVA